jgi:hypothetical protein
MSKTLFLFLFSNRPDSYINAMAHTFDRMQVEAVTLIYIKGAKTGLSDAEASTISNRTWSRLEELAGMAEVYRRMNERILNRHLVPITYNILKDQLNQLTKKHGGAKNCIIDLTGAAKAPSIDIFSVCLALGIKSVHLFELVDWPDPKNPDASLYHALGESGYSYQCLTSTDPVRASQSALLRKTPVLWAIGLTAFVVMAISLILITTAGPNSLPLQILNLAAAVVGLATPIIALLKDRQ